MKQQTNQVKKELIDALKGKRWLKCPYCKHNQFIRKEFNIVEISDDGESMTDEIVDDVGMPEYEYRCRNCDMDLIEEELI